MKNDDDKLSQPQGNQSRSGDSQLESRSHPAGQPFQ